MAGMEALGRLVNVIPIGAGNAFKMRGASGVLVVCTGTDTFTVNEASSFGGTYTALNCIKNVYGSTATNGTAGWTKLTYVNGTTPLSAVTIGGGSPTIASATMLAFHVFTSEFSDPFNYLKVTVAASGLVTVLPYDLVHQRGPANLEILGA
jgi:hypothetical protein